MAPRPELLTALQRLDLSRPPPDDAWVDGSVRGWGEPDRIRVLLQAGQRFRIGLHGPLGSGKTSELERWRRELEGVATVLSVRAADDAQAHAQPWAVVLEAVNTQLPMTVLGARVRQVVTEIRDEAIRARNAGGDARDSDGFRERFSVALTKAETVFGRPILILWDALDLLGVGQADDLLGPNGSLLDPALPALVVAVPHPWALERSAAQRHRSLDTLLHLPPFPVFDRGGRAAPAVVAAVAEGLSRRLGGVGLVEGGTELLERVALSSGGVPRHAVQILRQAVLRAALRGGKVDLAGVIEGERELRQDLEEAARNRLPQLNSFRVGGSHQRDVGLVMANVILGYEDGDGRYYLLHPLLKAMFA